MSSKSTSTKYGSFVSPISTDLVLSSSVSLSFPKYDSKSGTLFYLEGRASEAGRSVVISYDLTTKEKQEVIPSGEDGWNCRSRVHEYGGNSYTVMEGGNAVVFENFKGGSWVVERDGQGKWGTPKSITQESTVHRYADYSSNHPSAPNLLLAVHEDHTIDEPSKVINNIALLDTTLPPSSNTKILIEGADFYSSPRFSNSGKWISWSEWMHPNMPWENSSLYIASITFTSSGEIKVGEKRHVAGGKDESVTQPRWADDEDRLVYLSDRTGFYELYQWIEHLDQAELMLSEPTGYDGGPPDWSFGNQTHQSLSPGKWIAFAPKGQLRIIDLNTKSSTLVKTPYVSFSTLNVVSSNSIIVRASSDITSSLLATIDLDHASEPTPIQYESNADLDPGYISIGQDVVFPAQDGSDAYAIYYPPTNKDYPIESLDQNKKPPLIVYAHGGPTSSAFRGRSWVIQFLTSRGFAFCAVDYAGSSSYGKAYRQRLQGQWGLADVSDIVHCVRHLSSQGLIDAKRVGITGGSAGGFSVLAALCSNPEVFTSGVSHYGVSSLELLANDTHKFESQYLFGLLGGTPEQVPSHYFDRSPINHADKIKAPLLLLQGSEDRVVPPAQAERMKEVVLEKGGQCKMVIFEGEGHGFRKKENCESAMKQELNWFRETWGIEGGEQ